MKKKRLKNGITVLSKHRNTDTVTILVHVGTGSNNEHPKIAGISHFLEHMIFEGTKTRSNREIAEAIENVGGEFNASTANERTVFYAKLPKKHFELGLDILSDILINPSFDPKIFEKEKKVVLEEIKMIKDQPLSYQWVLFEKTLFKKHPTKNPVYGRTETVRKITVEQMKNYYKKWYVPGNMRISIVGNVKNPFPKAEKYFGKMKRKAVPKTKKTKEPAATRKEIKKEKRKINQAYFIMGNKTVPRMHKDSFVLDVIATIFHKGISGRITNEIRVKRGLAYSAGAHHETEKDYGFFAFYLNTDKKNIELCKKIIFEEIKKLNNLETKEINDAKEHIIGKNLVEEEDTERLADQIAFWDFIKDEKMTKEYMYRIRQVTKKDILKARDKYLNKNYTLILLGDV